jgi:hypothetical protein
MTEDIANTGEIGLWLVDRLGELTWERHGGYALSNAAANRAAIRAGQTIRDLRGETFGEGDSAIILAAGPSLRRLDPAKTIKRMGYKGTIVCTESALAYCLQNDIVPHLTITLDPHPKRIVRWFGDPELTVAQLESDDYFRRQDFDEAFRQEMKLNEYLIGALNRHGPRIAIALSSSASPAVVARVREAGLRTFWWNPMVDDPELPDSVARQLMNDNGAPCMNTGGNVGTAAWLLSESVLGKKKIGIVGIDFSYYPGTSYLATQYYPEIVALVGADRVREVFIDVHNPLTGQTYFTDPALYWYRNAFLDFAGASDCRTFNCAEGGIVFGEGIEFLSLEKFIDGHR